MESSQSLIKTITANRLETIYSCSGPGNQLCAVDRSPMLHCTSQTVFTGDKLSNPVQPSIQPSIHPSLHTDKKNIKMPRRQTVGLHSGFAHFNTENCLRSTKWELLWCSVPRSTHLCHLPPLPKLEIIKQTCLQTEVTFWLNLREITMHFLTKGEFYDLYRLYKTFSHYSKTTHSIVQAIITLVSHLLMSVMRTLTFYMHNGRQINP